MEASNLQIYWHESQPIYSLCFQPNDAKRPKLLTAGGDNRVRAWMLNFEKENHMKVDTIDFLSSLTQHEQAVNVIRFNSTGEVLASAGDDGQLLLWRQNDEMVKEFGMDDVEFDEFKESWAVWKKIRSGSDAFEIYDLAWSPNDRYIVTASMDNAVRIFDVEAGKRVVSVSDHNHYVQGVVWDPLDQYIFSQSADRALNVYEIVRDNEYNAISGLKLKNKIIKGDLPQRIDEQNFDLKTTKNCMLFHNETLPSFFRRAAISPCGNLLCVPAGIFKSDASNEIHNSVYIYTRAAIASSLNRPTMCLPFLKRPAIAVSFNPNRYELTTDKVYVQLPYKLVFAVATSNEILIYDTESVQPLGIVGNLHYTPLTDLSWSQDGSLLMVSSTDGFCSYVCLDQSILGTKIENNSSSPVRSQTEGITTLQEGPKNAVNILPVKRAGPTRDQGYGAGPKRIHPILIQDDQHKEQQQ
ncbi:hypothetical protein ZYGR_0AZ01110 [Zygosaccharomyces rouxii]|uniref:CAF1B/HIR1 beta-propeller domain-containing protein n=1 Tax=Zygosaccharomyces rouxii TaxID=4956 RepID=A0A1Q3AJN1_ZYGRO|nr:hypothetical protein ZYGR_0AZ01110 [Zygosaccharomyces rouxii]